MKKLLKKFEVLVVPIGYFSSREQPKIFMKKLLSSFVLAAAWTVAAHAQDANNAAPTPNSGVKNVATNINEEARKNGASNRDFRRNPNFSQKTTGPDDKYANRPERREIAENKRENFEKRDEQNAQNREKFQNSSLEERKQILEAREKKIDERIAQRQQKYDNASPEERARMDERREMMEKLSPQQREAVKKEMERHHAEMKKITGFDPR